MMIRNNTLKMKSKTKKMAKKVHNKEEKVGQRTLGLIKMNKKVIVNFLRMMMKIEMMKKKTKFNKRHHKLK